MAILQQSPTYLTSLELLNNKGFRGSTRHRKPATVKTNNDGYTGTNNNGYTRQGQDDTQYGKHHNLGVGA